MNLKNIAKSKKILTIINSVLLLALLLFLIINQRTIIKIYNYNKANQEKAIEAAKPANLNIIVLQEPNCENCSNLTPLINAIKKENVKINYEKTVIATSSEGIKLIDKYNIKKAPTIVNHHGWNAGNIPRRIAIESRLHANVTSATFAWKTSAKKLL